MSSPIRKIERVFIANRGEIALRIMRTCKEMGIETVIGCSKADRESLPVLLAQESVCIGDNLASRSYLNAAGIIQAACLSGCDAIHPGFGFLSENAEFARMCEECGLTFIGPSWSVIAAMGSKTEARALMKEAGIPLIPGSEEAQSEAEALETAVRIGFPVLIKACSGGGGKGMRKAGSPDDFHAAYENARREAETCFGDGRVYVEKAIENPKHIEVQIAADRFGHCVHLYERDCSFQIRNQKLLEEAPCSSLDPDLRERMCQTAVKAALCAGYDSIGTVEFLLDEQGNFYFMEMNTRIQVEHPITEMVTGVDLVALQIKAAEGYELSLRQDAIHLQGSALECRINAQDPDHGLQASVGTIQFLNLPGGSGIRVDGALYQGMQVYPFYDPMLCKLIAYAPERGICIRKMKNALEEFVAQGVQTNEAFHYAALQEESFCSGRYTTAFGGDLLERWKSEHRGVSNESVS